MADTFAAAAAKLAGVTGAMLGWRPHEFWRCTPAELAAIFAAFGNGDELPLAPDVLADLKERFPDG